MTYSQNFMLQEEILEEMNTRIRNIESLTQGSLEAVEIQTFMNAEKLEEIEHKIMLIFQYISDYHRSNTLTPRN
jgi:hypothetical protein